MTDNKALDHLNLCLQAARMGIWEGCLTKDPYEGRDIKWDSQVRAMHGMPEDYQGDLGEWFYKYLHADDLANVTARIAKIYESDFDNHRIFTFSYRFRWPNGELHYIEMHASIDPQDSDPNRIKVYGVVQDITQDVSRLKIIEDQKNRLLSASRMAVLGEISSGIAHEINNPLTVIQARSFQLQQMCENGSLDPVKVKSAAESISKTGDKIARIVKSLHAFAQRQDNEPVDKILLHELIQETLDFCKVRFFNHGIDVQVGKIPGHLEFECHLIQMEEALLSIFNNAHDAIMPLSEKWILIEASDKNEDIEIHITDSGNGIPEETADKMMLPFFSTKEIGKGMGLGLCIASEIISKHHGSLIYDHTAPNTKFIIRIPKNQPHINVDSSPL